MSRIKKISDCGVNITLMKNMRARLIEISLNIDNYIYQQKPITKTQAKAFLDEISSYKLQCGDDLGFLQVIEKLTKHLNIIISNYGNGNTDRAEVFDDIANQSPLIKASNNIVFVDSSIQNKHISDKPINGQNISESTFNNEPTLDIAKVNSNVKYDDVTKCCNKLNKISLRETVDFQEHCITNDIRISQNIVENCFNVKSDNNLLLDKTVGVKVNKMEVKRKGNCKALTKTELPTIINSEDENGKTKLTNTRTSNNLHKNNRPKKPTTKKVSKTNTKVEKIKDASTGKEKKTKRIVVKSKINKPKNSDALLKEIKSNSNKFNEKVSDDLSWFESIKYVRKIDEQEYFSPLQRIDDKFWYNHTLPVLDAKDFNI